MANENPLVALGVPRYVLIAAVKSKNPKLALTIAEANYKSLAKQFHPDLPGGDADYMSELGDAIEELRDLDALEYYLSELVGQQDVAAQRAKSREKSHTALIEKRDSYSLKAVSDLFEYVDQFSMLGLRKPATFFTYGQSVIMTIDIKDEESSELVGYIDESFFATTSDAIRYTSGKWQFKDIGADLEADTKASKKWHELGEPSLRLSAKVVGYIIQDRKEKVEVDTDVQALDSTVKIHDLQWTTPSESWFLPFISFGGLPVSDTDPLEEYDVRLVLYRDATDKTPGMFSVTQRIYKFAVIK